MLAHRRTAVILRVCETANLSMSQEQPSSVKGAKGRPAAVLRRWLRLLKTTTYVKMAAFYQDVSTELLRPSCMGDRQMKDIMRDETQHRPGPHLDLAVELVRGRREPDSKMKAPRGCMQARCDHPASAMWHGGNKHAYWETTSSRGLLCTSQRVAIGLPRQHDHAQRSMALGGHSESRLHDDRQFLHAIVGSARPLANSPR